MSQTQRVFFAGAVICTAIFSEAFSGCAFIQQRTLATKCKFRILSIDVRNFSLSEVTLDLHLEIMNPNKIDVIIDKMDLGLYIENKRVADVVFDGTTIPSAKTKTLVAGVAIPYAVIGMPMSDIAGKGRIRYSLKGTAYMDTKMGELKFPVTIYEN